MPLNFINDFGGCNFILILLLFSEVTKILYGIFIKKDNCFAEV